MNFPSKSSYFLAKARCIIPIDINESTGSCANNLSVLFYFNREVVFM